MWFDSHCHLHLCEEDGNASQLLERARAAGVQHVVTVGIDLESSRRAIELAWEPGVHASVGVHPNSADDWDEVVAATTDELAGDERVRAIGESGLDFYRERVTPEQQRLVFAAHIELAKKHDKALVIHTRESVGEALRVLAQQGPPSRFVFHCWSGGRGDLSSALDLGSHISFAGNVSFRSAEQLRELAVLVPEDRLLVETDSPFLTPVPHRGAPNEPAYVPYVGAAVAAARGISAEAVAAATSANARHLFGLG